MHLSPLLSQPHADAISAALDGLADGLEALCGAPARYEFVRELAVGTRVQIAYPHPSRRVGTVVDSCDGTARVMWGETQATCQWHAIWTLSEVAS